MAKTDNQTAIAGLMINYPPVNPKRNKKLVIAIIILSIVIVGIIITAVWYKWHPPIIAGEQEYNTAETYYKEKNYNEALKNYKKSAELGYEKAKLNLARMYYRGEGVSRDYCATKNYAESLCHNGKTEYDKKSACKLMSILYKDGLCVSQNSNKAREYLDKSE